MIQLGDVPASSTIYIPFTTYGGTNGESVTCSGLAVTDIEIYKNGSTTQRASDAGIALLDTDGIDFDGITGLHGFSIDLSDNTDASFYAVGSWYWVVVSAITVDSQTVTFLAATFRISPAESVSGHPKVDASAIAGNSTSATNLSKSALGIVSGACEGTPSTTSIQTDLAETTNGHYIGRVVVFTSGDAAGEATDITGYTGATGTLTVTALTTAPAATDTFVIV